MASSTVFSIALIGPGLVGKEFIQQIQSFKNTKKCQIKLVGLMSSRIMKINLDGINDATLMEDRDLKSNLNEFLAGLKSTNNCIVVDCTSSDQIAAQYPTILKSFHLVTPNKKGFSGSLELWESIKSVSLEHGKFALHESTVGAGLPILSTLNDLLMTGDEIVKIEGIFSGTLSYIFNNYSRLGEASSVSFSDIVKQAKELGYTEPDPRDDLNGMDVARKVVILGRLAALPLAIDTLKVENIVPAELRDVPDASSFLAMLPSHDAYFASMNKSALEENSVLRYVGVVDPKGTSSVSLQKYPASHPFASLKGSDNIIAFTTKRFPNPLIVQGAGAGAAVTAFGMFSDVLKIIKSIVGPL